MKVNKLLRLSDHDPNTAESYTTDRYSAWEIN